MKNTFMISTVVAIIAAGLGFYGGTQYQQTKLPSGMPDFANMSPEDLRGNFPGADGERPMPGANSANGGARGMMGGATIGEIISKDDSRIVVQLPEDQGTKVIFYATDTAVSQRTTSDQTALEVGTTISATGSTNDDGSVIAESIQIMNE